MQCHRRRVWRADQRNQHDNCASFESSRYRLSVNEELATWFAGCYDRKKYILRIAGLRMSRNSMQTNPRLQWMYALISLQIPGKECGLLMQTTNYRYVFAAINVSLTPFSDLYLELDANSAADRHLHASPSCSCGGDQAEDCQQTG
ncbi:hypothetical protein BaRGS_00028396 [Batillaria attramentaria]|uniref:Uncharacterized protein n=1 Tax=Batillaria attramentaria TaxID=370345 RepID=A0ABD0JZA7_9CAEN